MKILEASYSMSNGLVEANIMYEEKHHSDFMRFVDESFNLSGHTHTGSPAADRDNFRDRIVSPASIMKQFDIAPNTLFSQRIGVTNMEGTHVTILYDNGETHVEKNLVKTNALSVHHLSGVEGKGQNFLEFARKKATEVQVGVFQAGEFKVDMFSIAALQITKPNGEIVLRQFKACAKVTVLLGKQ